MNKGLFKLELLLKDFKINGKINEKWIKENCYIAGGACVSNFIGNKINDIDIYFKTKESLDYFMNEFGYIDHYFRKDSKLFNEIDYIDSHKLDGKEIEINNEKIKIGKCKVNNVDFYTFDGKNISTELLNKQRWMFLNDYEYVLIEKNHFDVDNNIFLGNKSITIVKKETPRENMKYQFILRFFGDPAEMMDRTFDFQHCKIAFDLKDRRYIASDRTYECLSKRKIEYVNSFYPISSMKRLFKYKSRGFGFSNDEFVKIIKDIHKINVENKYVIEDQVIGYYEDFNYDSVFCCDEKIRDEMINMFQIY